MRSGVSSTTSPGSSTWSTGPWCAASRRLPFRLTGAQLRAIEEIEVDLASADPMHRLLQGEVGSGKTVVAVAALLTAVRGGYQGAVMAPTEVSPAQHFLGMVDCSTKPG